MTTAEQLVRSDAERDALSALREAAGESGGAMERHCVRDFLIADRLAGAREIEVDRELLLVAALLHDIGIYDSVTHGGVYVTEGAELSAELTRRHGWNEERVQLCSDAVERHHELRSQWDRGAEVEVMRRADLIDVSGGLVRFGLSREWLRDLSRSVPRDGLYGELGRLVGHVLRHRPLTLPQIFIRR
jgi:hypothetical protein